MLDELDQVWFQQVAENRAPFSLEIGTEPLDLAGVNSQSLSSDLQHLLSLQFDDSLSFAVPNPHNFRL
jgi:hypothetical protein